MMHQSHKGYPCPISRTGAGRVPKNFWRVMEDNQNWCDPTLAILGWCPNQIPGLVRLDPYTCDFFFLHQHL